MKKFLLLFVAIAVLAGVHANAQYFQHVYGVPGGKNFLSGGINTTGLLGQGHFMVGVNYANQTLIASRTDINGDVPGFPYFNNEYFFNTAAGNMAGIYESKTVELPNNMGFGVAGLYEDGGTGRRNVYYAIISPTGTITGSVAAYLPAATGTATYQIYTVSSIALSSNNNDLYITGTTMENSPAGPSLHIYVINIDIYGSLKWALVYDVVNAGFPGVDFARDIIENPYSPAGVPEVVVVGQTYYDTGGLSSDGFFLRINALNGTPLSGAQLYGTGASWDFFNCITVANSMAGGSNGFIIGGGSSLNGTMDDWLVKVNPVGSPVWAMLYDYNGPLATSYNECSDVIERLNTSGAYEYYALSSIDNGTLGVSDMVVIKTDAMGNGVPMGQFTYGDTQHDVGVCLDQNNTGTGDGLSIFGFHQNAGGPGIGYPDMYLVKAYFNGLSGCNEDIRNPIFAPGPTLYNKLPTQILTKFTTDNLSNYDVPASDLVLCYSPSISGGSNALIVPGRPDDSRVTVVSTPGAQNLQELQLNVQSDVSADVQVSIYDMLGRLVGNSQASLVKGTNTVSLDMSRMSLTPGVYNVIIKGAGKDMHTLFMVK